MYFFFYNIGIWLYGIIAKLLALFQPKAHKWVEGRSNWFQDLEEKLSAKAFENKQFIWFHCASLGEFEQGRPVIEAIKAKYPNERILLTFFSPSGYEIRKNYAFADIVVYLPLDTKQNAQRFIDLVQPKMVFWVKYEYWYHFLETLHQRQIPIFLVSGIFRVNHFFFSPFGKSHRQCLDFFTHLFVQNEESEKHLHQVGFKHTSVVGDTRLDRVLAIAAANKKFEIVTEFATADERPIIVCGSTWSPDEAVICQYINNHKEQLPFRFIIAPHEIKELKINSLVEKVAVKTVRYSIAKKETVGDFEVLIIDNVGMLSALYRYGKIAYIGGALGSGLHNTLEPIVFGLPVIFGTKYQKFEEAVTLVEQKGGFSIANYEDFLSAVEALQNDDFYQKASKIAQRYVDQNQGATQAIVQSKQVESLLG